MEVIVDTNIFIDALCHNDEHARLVLDNEHRGLYSFVMSDEMREELILTLEVHLWMGQLPKSDIQEANRILNRLLHRTRRFNPVSRVRISPDDTDNKFFACAIEAPADYIITRNRRHFQDVVTAPLLNCQRRPISIMYPDEFNIHVLALQKRGRL